MTTIRFHAGHIREAVDSSMNRNRLPQWLNSLIDRIADSPTSWVGRIAARRMGRPAPAGTVPVTVFEDLPKRVLIAPVNYSEQGFAWARALERADPTISARNMSIEVPGGFAFRTDLEVPLGTYHNDRDWQERQLRAAGECTHFLIEAEEPPFGRLFGRSLEAQAQALAQRGVDLAFLAHGTDVRLPSRHAAENPWSSFHDPLLYLPRAEVLARRNIDYLTRAGRPIFVSTPDLLLDLPEASWCPVAVEPARWRTERAGSDARARPLRVVHSPSNSILKGTQFILPILQQLEQEGIIQFKLLQGVPSSEMPAEFAQADVMLDQFRAGSYGVAACEAMAAGCIVIGQVSEQVRAAVFDATGVRLPIVEATPDTIADRLRALSMHGDLAPQRAQSIGFVQQVHDGRFSARVLRDRWIDSHNPEGS